MTLNVLPEAREEARDATDWYAALGVRLKDRFTDALADSFAALTVHPQLYGEATPAVLGREVRQAPVHGFPYTVVYEVRLDELLVVAVAHDRRRARYWRHRLP